MLLCAGQWSRVPTATTLSIHPVRAGQSTLMRAATSHSYGLRMPGAAADEATTRLAWDTRIRAFVNPPNHGLDAISAAGSGVLCRMGHVFACHAHLLLSATSTLIVGSLTWASFALAVGESENAPRQSGNQGPPPCQWYSGRLKNYTCRMVIMESIEFWEAPDGALSIYKMCCVAAQGNWEWSRDS